MISRLSLLSLAALALGTVSALAQSDTQPPQLVGMSFTPPSVDVTASAQTVTFSVHLTDNLSGVNAATIYLRSPSGTQSPNGYGFVNSPGIVLDATVSAPVQIPRYAEPGTWTVAYMYLYDRVNNYVTVDTAALAALGIATTITVTDANPDTAGPEVTSITMTPSAIDVSAADATVTVELTITDALSGFSKDYQNCLCISIRSPSGNQSRYISPLQLVPVSGNTNSGVWRGTFKMPRYSEPGTWNISFISLFDFTGNSRFYPGWPSTLAVTSSPADTTAPSLTGLLFTPSFINTSLASAAVQADISMTDDLSGVSFAPDTPNVSFTTDLQFRSPSGAQYRYTGSSFYTGPPFSGTPLNGVWRFSAFFPQFSEEGTWKVSAYLRDAAGNRLTLTDQQIATLGIPNSIDVIRPTLQPDGTLDPATGGTISDNTFGNRAQLIIPGGVLSQATTIAIDVVQSPLSVPLPTGFSSAETYFVNVQLTPTPTFPLPAPGITVVLPLRNYVIPGTGINLYRIDPATGSLVPSLDVSGNPVIGRVDLGGLTATFLGVAHFSTVVGVLPTAIPVQIDIRPGRTPNLINLRSKGKVGVAIYSTATLDIRTIDPATLRFAGAPVVTSRKWSQRARSGRNSDKGKWRIRYVDLNHDGLRDAVAFFDVQKLLLGTADTQAQVEGSTRDGRLFRGTDSVQVVQRAPRPKDCDEEEDEDGDSDWDPGKSRENVPETVR